MIDAQTMRQLLRPGARGRIWLCLAVIGVAPVLTLVIVAGSALDGHGAAVAAGFAVSVGTAALVAWFAERRVLRPLAHLGDHLAQRGGPVAQSVPPIVRIQDRVGAASTQIAEDRAALETARTMHLQLSREIHHRVKNNLQIIASLLNLHRRGASDPAVIAAYRTIQQRVDTLTAVHRNMTLVGDDSDAVPARLLGDDLIAIFADPDQLGAAPSINMAIENQLSLVQDVALPVAFLLTELIDVALDIGTAVTVTMVGAGANSATLSISSPAFASPAGNAQLTSGHRARVLDGLSRQLRSPLVRSGDGADYSIVLMTVNRG